MGENIFDCGAVVIYTDGRVMVSNFIFNRAGTAAGEISALIWARDRIQARLDELQNVGVSKDG